MKVAFVGKGGSGKTTTSALFARYVAATGKKVLAIDADINQHLAAALGMSPTEEIPALGYHIEEIKSYVKGSNPRISPLDAMLKTTPPGAGSHLIAFDDTDFLKTYSRSVNGIDLMVTGAFDEEDIGLKCYHGKQGSAEIILNHFIDRDDEYIVVDLTAGADSFASGMFLKFDVTFLIVEPTLRGISVWQQYVQYAREHNIVIHVIGNKVENQEDIDFLRQHVGGALLATIGHSGYIKTIEKGRIRPIEELETPNQQTLHTMLQAVTSTKQDRIDFYQKIVAIHRKKAASETDEKRDALLAQIDPQFNLAEAASRRLA